MSDFVERLGIAFSFLSASTLSSKSLSGSAPGFGQLFLLPPLVRYFVPPPEVFDSSDRHLLKPGRRFTSAAFNAPSFFPPDRGQCVLEARDLAGLSAPKARGENHLS